MIKRAALGFGEVTLRGRRATIGDLVAPVMRPRRTPLAGGLLGELAHVNDVGQTQVRKEEFDPRRIGSVCLRPAGERFLAR